MRSSTLERRRSVWRVQRWDSWGYGHRGYEEAHRRIRQGQLDRLAWGNYLVQEVTPPTGYSLSDPPSSRHYQRGHLRVSGRRLRREWSAVDNGECGVASLTFANPPLGDIEVVTIDKATEAVLKGAVFQLWNDVEATVVHRWHRYPGRRPGDTWRERPRTTGDDGKATGPTSLGDVPRPGGHTSRRVRAERPRHPARFIDESAFCNLQPVEVPSDENVIEVPNECTLDGVVRLTFANPGTLKGIEIKKTVSQSSTFTGPDDFFTSVGGKPGTTSVYRFEVTNTGIGPVSNLVLTDDMFVGELARQPVEPVGAHRGEHQDLPCRIAGGHHTFTFGPPIRSRRLALVLPPDNPAATMATRRRATTRGQGVPLLDRRSRRTCS